MKKTVLILLCAICTACTDYLNVKPRGYDIPTTVAQYEGMLFGTDLFYLDEVFEFMSFEYDTDAAGYLNAYSNVGSAICNAYRWQKDIFLPDEACGEWNCPASFLYPLNVVIEEVMDASDGTEEKKLQILSEARMMRAWHLFTMAQFFGKPYNPATAASDPCIPIITQARTVGAEFPRKSVQEVYDFVLTEMEESLPHLYDGAEHYLRVFKPSGHAMLGKVLWMMGRYQEAEAYLAEALNSAKAVGKCLIDLNGLLLEDGTIEYPTDAHENPEYLYLVATLARLWPGMYTSYYNTCMFRIKPDVLMHYYTQSDARLAYISSIPGGRSAYRNLNANDVFSPNISGMLSNMGVGLPDVYLMYAECLARNGHADESAAVLYEFRLSRMDASEAAQPGADPLVAAVEERVREYMGYGNTWFDTRRLWNDPDFQYMKQYYTHSDGENTYTLTEDRLTMEIPPVILSWHPEYETNN